MQFAITKTGLDVFDTARAWGLAAVASARAQSDVRIRDRGWSFTIDVQNAHTAVVGPSPLLALIDATDENWSFIFITSSQEERKNKISDVEKCIKSLANTSLLQITEKISESVFTSRGKTLPGGLDPGGFKGVRQKTRARYDEGQLRVNADHWALACLGMVLSGTYQRIGSGSVPRTIALLPVPLDVTVAQWAEIRELTRWPRATPGTSVSEPRLSRQVAGSAAAAQAAVQLAERVRKRAVAQGSLVDRFSDILFFELFKTGNQQKPAQGNRIRLDRLMAMIQHDATVAEGVFEWLNYCFRRGSAKGAQDLALAAADFVFRWDVDSYDRLVRLFVRYLVTDEIRLAKRPSEEVIGEVLRYVSV